MSSENGADGFSNDYWDENYREMNMMDGIANAKQHARYIKSMMSLETIDVSSVIDFGFGLGYMLKEVLNIFKPYRAMGLEPSLYAFNKVKETKLTTVESINLKLKNIDLATWAIELSPKQNKFDLGLCTSVFQYLTDQELELVIPAMARSVSYLYLSVPTDLELKRQRNDLDFHDRFAFPRTKGQYRKLIKDHFTIVSSRLLESRYFVEEDDSPFSDLLFRF
jgi:hypothetical protein